MTIRGRLLLAAACIALAVGACVRVDPAHAPFCAEAVPLFKEEIPSTVQDQMSELTVISQSLPPADRHTLTPMINSLMAQLDRVESGDSLLWSSEEVVAFVRKTCRVNGLYAVISGP